MKNSKTLLGALAMTLLFFAKASAQGPPVTAQPLALSLGSGQVAVFKVAATGALSYQWRKDGADLALSDRVSGVTGPILSISPALAGDAGVYTVLASNAEGSTLSDPATLAMNLTLPVFTLAALSQTCAAGTTADFSAATSGSEPITYRWMRYGTPLSDDGRISGATTSHLAITALTSADSGWYWLTASNADGIVSSDPARLTVTTPGDLGAAVNYLEGAWTCGGSGGAWLPQSGFAQDGSSALRSPPILFSSSTYIETTVYGPGELSFYWAVSSEPGFDPFACQLDGVELANISGEQMGWTQRKFAIGWGPHVVRWLFSVDQSKSGEYNAGFLDQVAFTPMPVVSLETAAAPVPLPLRTSGDAAWFGQTAVNHDGNSAARCGYITHNQSTTVETTVCGPGLTSFNWKVSSEWADPLEFLVDGVAWDQIASEVDWTNRTFRIPWGIHTLSWRFRKDVNDNDGARDNAAWLDEVTFTPVTLSGLSAAAGDLSPWTAGGTLPFFGQNEITFDGTAALQSGPITHDQSSSAQSGVTGPGTLTFRWKVSSDDDDFLRFAIDGNEQARIAAEVDWTAKTYVIRPGQHVFDWSYHKDSSVNTGYDAGWIGTLAFVSAPSLAVALNAPALSWTTSGNGTWFPEMVTTHDGAACARSGDIGNNQAATMETTVTGPGTLAFWWKVSSEYADPLIFLIDGVEQTRISGEPVWANPTFNLTAGSHTLSWRYQKDNSVALGADAGWVDQVTLSTAGMTYPSWAATRFSPEELADPAISGDSADAPDHDGIPNLLEYALALEPASTDTHHLPTAGKQGGYLTLTYRQSKGTTDLTFTPQASSSPSGLWTSDGLEESARENKDTYWLVTVRDNTPIAGLARRFMRLHVTGN